jgi:hypothetical protein
VDREKVASGKTAVTSSAERAVAPVPILILEIEERRELRRDEGNFNKKSTFLNVRQRKNLRMGCTARGSLPVDDRPK